MVAANSDLRLPYRDSGSTVLAKRAMAVFAYQPLLTAADLHTHAWIHERLAVLDRERHSLWAKMRRFLLAKRPS
jgi:hypothetical protein